MTKIKLHICKDNICQLKDKECADILNSGFTVEFVDKPYKKVVTDKQHKVIMRKQGTEKYNH